MFGLKAVFAALARFAAAVNRSAELFESANAHLERQLGFDAETPAVLEHTANGEERKPRPARSR